jgi:hypothetical protein
VSWLFVVGGVIVLALALHFAEQRKSKAILLARRAARQAPVDLHRFSLSRQVQESWVVDLRTMLLELSRGDDAATTYRLERGADGAWQMRPSSSQDASMLPVPVPASVAERLEQQYQRFSRAAPGTASR